MENDLKIIFYIVVAIIWVVYNNYRKIAGESRKRDPSKAPEEVIKENWPTPSGERRERSASPQTPTVITEKVKRKVQPVAVESRPKPLKKSAQRQTEDALTLASMVNPTAEGGLIKPSGMVHFEEPAVAIGEQSALLDKVRLTELQTAFLWSEILKNPYNQSLETLKYG